MRVTVIPILIDGPKKLERKTAGSGNQRENLNHPDYSIVDVGQNTQKSPGELRSMLSLRIQWNATSCRSQTSQGTIIII